MTSRWGVVRTLRQNRAFFATMLTLGIPIALQNLISSCLNMVDTVMIGRLGEAELAAVGLAGQVFFFFMICVFGICSGTNVFIAQYWGKKDLHSIRQVNGLGTILCLALALPFTVATTVFPVPIMHIFTRDAAVMAMGATFLRITGLTYCLFGVNMSFSFAMRAIGQPRVPLVIGTIALIVNTALGYILIFGPLGLPHFGVAGAAAATLVSRVLEATLTLSYVYGRRTVLASSLKELTSFTWGFFVRYLDTAGAVIMNEGLWSMAILLVNVAYSRLGTTSVAAFQISNTIQNLFFVIIFGVSNASSIMIGQKVGQGHLDEARHYARLCLGTSVALGIAMGGLLLVTSPVILVAFRVAQSTAAIAVSLLRVLAAVTLMRFVNIVVIVGILRGGGDTKFSLYIDVGSLWLIGVPLAFLGATVWHLSIAGVVALVAIEEVAKAGLGLWRVGTGRWVRDVTVARVA